jgi:hypothetical protein
MENFVSSQRKNYIMYTDNTVNDSLLFLGRNNNNEAKAPNKRELKRRLEESYAQTKKDIDSAYVAAVAEAEKVKPASPTTDPQATDAYFAALKSAADTKAFKLRAAKDDYEVALSRIEGATEDEIKIIQERQRVLNAKEDEYNNTLVLIYSDIAKAVRQTSPNATPTEIRNTQAYKDAVNTASEKYKYAKNDLTAQFATQLKKLRRAQNLGKTAEIINLSASLSGLSKQANVPPAEVQLAGDNKVIPTAELETAVNVQQTNQTPPANSNVDNVPPPPPTEAGFFSGKAGKIIGVLFIVATLGYLAVKFKDGDKK